MRLRPFSMLMELTIARPGMCSSAASMTFASVESIMSGVSTLIDSSLTTFAICSASSRALGQRDADVEHVRARLHLLARDVEDALVVVGEQQPLHLARALRVHALADEQRRRILVQRDRAHRRADARDVVRLRAAERGCVAPTLRRRAPLRRSPSRCSGVVPQQPPTMRTPNSLHELASTVGHRRRLERIHRLADARVEREPGVRDAPRSGSVACSVR